MLKEKILLSFVLLLVLFFACTPKVTEPAKETVDKPPVKEEPKDEKLSPCKKWVDSPKLQEAKEAHVLYRDAIKVKDYDQAFLHWKTAYEIAPAADGKRDFHYTDGIKIYKHFIDKETDETKKKEYIDIVFNLYDEAINCYPDNAAMYKGLQAFDLYYKYTDRAPKSEVYNLFKYVIDTDGEKTQAHIINPFTAILIERIVAEEISMAEGQTYALKIIDIIDFHTKELKNKGSHKWKSQGWDIVESYSPNRLEELEGVEGFYGCEYYKSKYYKEYEANPTNCDAITGAYGRLKWGKCEENDPQVVILNDTWKKNCYKAPEPTASSTIRQANDALRNGQYKTAVALYEQAIDETDKSDKKATYALTIAKIYYGHLKSYSKSRRWARAALKHRSNWGDPYILIGKLYASSGPLCGSGRGWNSQVVTWPAIDKWQKAKSVDSSVSSEANRLIGKYSKYMPDVEAIFQRGLKEGDSFSVGCWIQEKTKIRAARN